MKLLVAGMCVCVAAIAYCVVFMLALIWASAPFLGAFVTVVVAFVLLWLLSDMYYQKKIDARMEKLLGPTATTEDVK